MLIGCGLPALVLFLALLVMCTGGGNDDPAPTRSTYSPPPATSNNVTQARFDAVKSAFEQAGARVEGSPPTMRVYVPAMDMTDLQAQQTAKMAYDRLGDNAIVRVYDRSGLERAKADLFGVD